MVLNSIYIYILFNFKIIIVSRGFIWSRHRGLGNPDCPYNLFDLNSCCNYRWSCLWLIRWFCLRSSVFVSLSALYLPFFLSSFGYSNPLMFFFCCCCRHTFLFFIGLCLTLLSTLSSPVRARTPFCFRLFPLELFGSIPPINHISTSTSF